MLGAHKLCHLVRRIATPTQAAITTSVELPAAGSLSAVPAAPLSRGLRRFRNRCWERTRAANCTALHMKSERVFLFESIAATITSGNIAATATKGSSATAAAPYGRAPTSSLRILPRTPGTSANALAGGHDADGHRPVRDLHNGVLDTQHHGVVTNRYATRMFDAGASRTSASSFFGLPIIRSSDLRDQQQLHAGTNHRNVRIMLRKRGKI